MLLAGNLDHYMTLKIWSHCVFNFKDKKRPFRTKTEFMFLKRFWSRPWHLSFSFVFVNSKKCIELTWLLMFTVSILSYQKPGLKHAVTQGCENICTHSHHTSLQPTNVKQTSSHQSIYPPRHFYWLMHFYIFRKPNFNLVKW